MSGTLFGIGVGPGDPELLTLKAVRLIASADLIAYPAPADGTPSMARQIAAPHIPDGKDELVIETPMIPGVFPADDVYNKYAEIIDGALIDGRDVAVLCEGDPFLYGSFMYLFGRLSGDHKTVVVPGVSSLGACAAQAGRPLVSRNQVLSVLPAPIGADALKAQLSNSDAAAIMKVGRHLDTVRSVLNDLGWLDEAVYVERATLETERVIPLKDLEADKAPYFSMILVRRTEAVES